MSKSQNQDRLKLVEITPTPPTIPFVISLFMVTGRFRGRRRKKY